MNLPAFEILDPEGHPVQNAYGALDRLEVVLPPDDGRTWVGFRFFPIHRRKDPFWEGIPRALWWVPATTEPSPVSPPFQPSTIPPDPDDIHEHPDRSTWNRWIRKTLEQLGRGIPEKVVLARYRQIRGQPPSLQAMREHPAWGYRFRILLSPEVAWFGITPETFLHWKQGWVYLDALAGTLPRPVYPVPRALQVEHRAVVTYLVHHLQPFSHKITVSPQQWKQVGTMVHLHTRIQAPLSRDHVPALTEILFPTPALAGSPRDEALNWIQETEDFDRGGYGGLVGWFTPDEVFLLVAIRCGVYRKGWVRWYAGAGIVPGMDPDELWEETTWKLNVMGRLLLPSRTSGPGS